MNRKMMGDGLLNGKTRLVAIIALALALLIPTTATTFAANGAPTPAGDICVNGFVIDWQEEPLEEGWYVEATPLDASGNPVGDAVTAEPSDDDDEKGQFEFENDDLLVNGNKVTSWQFAIIYDDLIGDWRPVTSDVIRVDFDYGADGCARIRFKLKEVVAVGVLKIDAEHNGLEDWKIIATPAKDNLFAIEQDVTTDASGQGEELLYLTPGKWVFTEESPEDVGHDFAPVIPMNGQQTLLLESAEDRANDDNPDNDYNPDFADYVVRFKNDLKLKGCVEVYKFDVPPGEGSSDDPTQSPFGLAGWEITVLRADGSEEAFGYTDASGRVKFEHLAFGPYTIKEESRSGWEAVGPDAYDVHLSTEDDGCAVVIFDNIQAEPVFVIEGYKLDANEHYGLPGWEIKADPLSKNGYEPDNVFTDGTGYYRFELPANDYRVPGAKYEVCEDDDVDGWLPHTSTCFTVTLPKHPGTVKVPDFVNQQVGHSESQKPSGSWSGGGMSGGSMGPSMGGGMMGGNMGGGMDMKCSKVHMVEKGEGLYEIGAMYMKPAGAMLAANSWIQDRTNHYLYPGDKVCIP
jgi:hypothetical protein